jgi:hypothetical protein
MLIPLSVALFPAACAVAQPAMIVVPGSGKDQTAFQQDAVACRQYVATQPAVNQYGNETAYDQCMAYHGNIVQQLPDGYVPPAYAYDYPYPFGYPFYGGGLFAGFAFAPGFHHPFFHHNHFHHGGFPPGGFHRGFHPGGFHGGFHHGGFHGGGFHHGGFHGGGFHHGGFHGGGFHH